MTWEEYLARVAETRGCAENCGRTENLPHDWAQQLRAVLREAKRQAEADVGDAEIEAG